MRLSLEPFIRLRIQGSESLETNVEFLSKVDFKRSRTGGENVMTRTKSYRKLSAESKS